MATKVVIFVFDGLRPDMVTPVATYRPVQCTSPQGHLP